MGFDLDGPVFHSHGRNIAAMLIAASFVQDNGRSWQIHVYNEL